MQNAKQEKKPTNGQLQKRISNAVIHVDRTKDTKEVYFEDRGIRIVVSDGRAIISQLSFTMVFDEIVAGGYSRIYATLSHVVDVAHKYDCMVVDNKGNKTGYSFWKLRDEINKSNKEGHEIDAAIVTKFHIWFSLHQSSMFLLSERPDFTFAMGAQYALNAIISGAISKPYDKDMTNKDLFKVISDEFNTFRENYKEEDIVLRKETDEERKQAIAKAMEEDAIEKGLKGEGDGNKK